MTTTTNFLLDSFDERWKKYRAQLKVCKREFSEEAVHDLRVATRRLLAMLDVLRRLDPHPRIQKSRRALKNRLDALDDLRDVQVMVGEISEAVSTIPELKPFEAHLQGREKRLLRISRKQIKESRSADLSKRMEKIRLGVQKILKSRNFRAQLLAAVDQTYLRATQAHGQIDASQPSTIHSLRIAFKKFRYTVEIVHPLLIDYPESHLERMHEYQSKMGLIQDVQVFLSNLAEFTEENASDPALDPARRYFGKRLAEITFAFLEDKDEIRVFWRAASDQPFTWEKNHETVHHPSRNRRGSGDARLRRRQPEGPDRKRRKKDVQDRAGVEGTGGADGPDPDQPVSSRGTDGEHSEEGIQPQKGQGD